MTARCAHLERNPAPTEIYETAVANFMFATKFYALPRFSPCDAQNSGVHGLSCCDPKCKYRSAKSATRCLFDVYSLIVQATNLERNSLVVQNFEPAFVNFMIGTQNFMVTQKFGETASR